ncbi:MAG: hypothetical protein WAS51_06015 [Ilumatobacteraceae bacterium]|nr:MAG: hypothetical protein IPM43_01525 [Actinomycetota bacterium]
MKHRLPIGLAAAGLCLALAVVWWFVVPSEASDETGIGKAVLRYGHSAVWALLAVSALLIALGAPRRAYQATAIAAGAVYAAFVAALVF